MSNFIYRHESFGDEMPNDAAITCALTPSTMSCALKSADDTLLCFKVRKNSKKAPLAEFASAFLQEDKLFDGGQPAVVSILSALWLLQPQTFVQPEQTSKLLGEVYDMSLDDLRRFSTPIPGTAQEITFAIPEALAAGFDAHFPGYAAHHYAATSIAVHNHFHRQMNLDISAGVDVQGDQFVYVVRRDDVLLFCNVYDITSPEDILYYLYRVNNTLQLDTKALSLCMTGSSRFKREIARLLSTYFTKFVDLEAAFPRTFEVNRAAHHWLDYPAALCFPAATVPVS